MKKFRVTFFNAEGVEMFSCTPETEFGFRNALNKADGEFQRASLLQFGESNRIQKRDVTRVDIQKVPHA